jgi:hypothetical protein
MYRIMRLKKLFLLLFGVLFVGFVWSCNESPIEPIETYEYRIEGVFVSDTNLASTRIAVRLERLDTLLSRAEIAIDDTALVFDHPLFPVDSAYYYQALSSMAFTTGQHSLKVIDSAKFNDTLDVAVPDTFSILSVEPFDRKIEGNGSATLSWSGSAGAEAYVMAAVKVDSAYKGQGYSAYPQTGLTGGTIPPDAFLLPGGVDPDTGLYNLYVYALTGAPDSAISMNLLPVPLPEQLDDDIQGDNIVGRFGSIRITHVDTVRVTFQP